jgi:hypothetical protein
MAFPHVGLSVEIDAGEIKRCLATWFPTVEVMTMDDAIASNANPWPPIVFTAIANASEFPTLVTFDAFPGDSGMEVAIGLALARLFSESLRCRAVSDGSGLGGDSLPYWSIIQDGDRAFLVDDCGSTFVDGEGGPLRVVRELSLRIGKFDGQARLIDKP